MYEIFKALHIIAIVCWFAGLFYLPRLYVYHVKALKDPKTNTLLKTMERKLYFYITTPAMIASWVFGSLLIHLNPSVVTASGWLHAKLVFVLGLTVFHVNLFKHLKLFQKDNTPFSEKFYRMYNEIPTIVLVVVVFLAILKPF